MENSGFLFYFLVLLLVHCFMAKSIAVAVISTDQSALLALKAQISNDPDELLTSNWSSTDTSVCNWIGITCDSSNHRVTTLNLSDMGLKGTIPPNLGNLSFLTHLSFFDNYFHGLLPNELASLNRLEVADFGLNDLSGEIPSWFGFLPKLQVLSLYENHFMGTIPASLCNISSLRIIYLSKNMLSGTIPPNLASLRRLEVAGFGSNHLSGEIPSWFGFLPKLEELHLDDNNFMGTIPASLCNNISSVLRYIDFSINMLSGWIPRSLENCTSLKEIYLDENNFTGEVLHEMGNLYNLEVLSISNNSLTGHIPYTIFNMSTIKEIYLHMNNLSGHLPSNIGLWLPNLEQLYLWGNYLGGIIPTSISNASKLISIELNDNNFSGSVPSTLGNLRDLQSLNLARNELTSESSILELSFLTSLTNCENLTRLILDENPLNGTLTVSIGNFSTLEIFSTSGCKIKSTIPREIGNLSSLLTLRLKNNELSGSIPTTIGEMRKLQGLFLQGNRLQGSIPNNMCHLRNLYELHLSRNKLFGSIPTCWGNLTSLGNLYLDSNNFTSIPSSFWSLKEILIVNLSSNSLGGPLPLDIGNLKVVTLIDLSWNHLSGDIPIEVGGLERLQNLSLAHNKFQGPIPKSFGRLISVKFLDLSFNNLSGVIPKSLEKLSYLQYVNLSFNRLQGEVPTGGALANFSAQSFMGNEALCGAPRLQFPPCKTNIARQSKKGTAVILKYILGAISAMILVPALIFVWLRYRKRSAKLPIQGENAEELSEAGLLPLAAWRRISYLELERATDEFSESNLVGKGSFGSVYKGILEDGMTIAVKVFDLHLEGAFKSFDVECEVLCKIRHRNLVKIISSCTNIDFKALVLEYMPNGSLNKWLYSHNYFLDILQRVNIMMDVASSLEYLHYGYSKPIVHCDLKPSNILLNKDMIAHVGDFGIAKFLCDGDSISRTMTLATIGYMAPEYGSQGIISTKGDVYSYGILLMETFTNKKPTDEMFAGEKSLKHWVEESLPYALMKVVDANVLRREDENYAAKEDCILSIMRLAMDCSKEAPEERINMRDVLTMLEKIKKKLLEDVGLA